MSLNLYIVSKEKKNVRDWRCCWCCCSTHFGPYINSHYPMTAGHIILTQLCHIYLTITRVLMRRIELNVQTLVYYRHNRCTYVHYRLNNHLCICARSYIHIVKTLSSHELWAVCKYTSLVEVMRELTLAFNKLYVKSNYLCFVGH